MAYPTIAGANGFLPVNLMGGQVYAGAVRQIPIASTYGYNIGFGDLVTYTTTGTIVRVDTTSGAKAAFAAAPVGIFMGCTYTDPNLRYKVNKQYWPASTVATDAFALVADDPDIVMKVVLTNASGAFYTANAATQANVGENIGYYQPTTYVNTATGNSAISGNFASAATTNTLPLRIVDVVRETALSDGTFPEVLVTFNAAMHFYRQATGI